MKRLSLVKCPSGGQVDFFNFQKDWNTLWVNNQMYLKRRLLPFIHTIHMTCVINQGSSMAYHNTEYNKLNLKTIEWKRNPRKVKTKHLYTIISGLVEQYKLKRCSNKECCKQCRYVMFKGTMTSQGSIIAYFNFKLKIKTVSIHYWSDKENILLNLNKHQQNCLT